MYLSMKNIVSRPFMKERERGEKEERERENIV